MAETAQIVFSHKEVVEALIKQQGIHEGRWMIMMQFGIQGMNVGKGSPQNLVPAALVPIVAIGLQKTDQDTNLSVDAAEVNPAPAKSEGGEFEQSEYFR
jgi:hypothetical protein